MGEAGLMGIPVPEAYGGAGADTTSYILAIHEISKSARSRRHFIRPHIGRDNPDFAFRDRSPKQTYIPKLAAGEYIGAFALTEPQSGSDAGSLKTTSAKRRFIYSERFKNLYYKRRSGRSVSDIRHNRSG